MTITEFLDELSTIEGKPVPDSIFGSIRITCCDKQCLSLCPITAVYYKRTGNAHPPIDWWYISEKLGLSYSDATEIVDAADGYTGGALRQRLLNIVQQIKPKSEEA